MVGKYSKELPNILNSINSWIDETIQNNLWDNIWDLHIDEVSPMFKSKETWIEGSIYVRSLILKNDKTNYFDLLLSIPLMYSKISEPPPITIDDLMSRFSWTPPSFYIFQEGSTAISDTLVGAVEMKEIDQLFQYTVLYKEDYDQVYNEYNRVVFII